MTSPDSLGREFGAVPYRGRDRCWGCGLDFGPDGRFCSTCAELRQIYLDHDPFWHGFDPRDLIAREPG